MLISHLHADHFLDLVPFAYALTYAPRQQPVAVDGWPGTDNPARPMLHCPPGGGAVFRHVVGSWGNDDLIENAFELREYAPGRELEIGPLRVRFAEMDHFVQTFAVELRAAAGGAGAPRFVFGADTGPTEALVDFARGADLLVAEATLPRPEREGPRGHLTPGEAGDHAARAGVGRLVLTHISDELDAKWARDEARAHFGGEVGVAHEGAVYEV